MGSKIVFRSMWVAVFAVLVSGGICAAQEQKQGAGILQQMKQYLEQKEPASAIRVGKEYLESNPGDAGVLNMLAEVYMSQNEYASAEAMTKEALKAQPADPGTLRVAAEVYRLMPPPAKDEKGRAKNLETARGYADQGLKVSPDDIWLLAEKAQIEAELGDKETANRIIDKAISGTQGPDKNYLGSVKDNINKKKEESKK